MSRAHSNKNDANSRPDNCGVLMSSLLATDKLNKRLCYSIMLSISRIISDLCLVTWSDSRDFFTCQVCYVLMDREILKATVFCSRAAKEAGHVRDAIDTL